MVNINIEIPDDLHRKLKIIAALRGVSLKGLVVSVLEKAEVKHG